MTGPHPRRTAHHVCGGCYIEKVSARLDPETGCYDVPVRCCRCNRPASAILFWHSEPMWMFVPHCPWVVRP